MTTYETFMVLLTFAIQIVEIPDHIDHKKKHPRSCKVKGAVIYRHRLFY